MSLNIITSVPIESEEWCYFNELDIRGRIELFEGGEYEDGELICFTVPKEDWLQVEEHLKNKMSGVTYHVGLTELPQLPKPPKSLHCARCDKMETLPPLSQWN